MGDDRPNTYVEGDMVIYRASSTGNCIRGLAASRIGYDPTDHPEWLLAKFAEGNANEPRILEMVEAGGVYKLVDAANHGFTVVGGQVEVEVGIGSTIKVRGHLDGIAVELETGELVGVEGKALGKSFRAKYEKSGIMAFPYYATQLSLYMTATGLPFLFALGWKDKDGVVQEVHIEKFDVPPVSLGAVKARIAKVERAKVRNELPACDQDQYPCQFFYLHDDKDNEVVDSDVVVDDVADRWAHQLQRARVLAKEAEDMKKEASDALGEILKTHLGGEFKTRLFEIRYKSRTTKSYDFVGLERHLGAHWDDFVTQGMARWPDVKAK